MSTIKRSSRRPAGLGLFFVFGLALATRPLRSHAAVETNGDRAATASSKEEPEEMVRRGLNLRRAGRDDLALALFREALELRSEPRTLAQIGLAEQALGRWTEAEKHLDEALAATGDVWIGAHRLHLEESLAFVRQHVSSLSLEVEAEGAEVAFGDGGFRPVPQAPVRIAPGPVSLRVRAPGRSDVAETVDLSAGTTLLLRLQPAVALALPPAAPPAPTPLIGLPRGAAARPRSVGAITLATASGVMLAEALAAQLYWWIDRKYLLGGEGCRPLPGASRREQCPEEYANARLALELAVAGYIASAALGATAGWLYHRAAIRQDGGAP
jgi:tetratricopeptide (TPR) repeat protein